MHPEFLKTLPTGRSRLPMNDACIFTSKPRSLDLTDFREVAFVPMDQIPIADLGFSSFTMKDTGSISSGTYFEEGDLLLSKITPCFENGKQGIVRSIPNGFGFATTEVIPIKARDGVTHLPFVAFYLLHQEVRMLLAASMEGATGRQRLPKDVLAEWPVPIPPLGEQRAMAGLLESIQLAARHNWQSRRGIGELRVATMARLFHEGLRGEPLKESAIGLIPESWDVKSLIEVTDPVSGGTPSKQRLDWWEGSTPWASPKDMKKLRLSDTQDHITEDAAQQGSRLVPAGTIFIVIRGMILAKDVPVAIADVPMAFNQDMKALVPTGAIDPDFLLHALCARKSALVQEIGTSAHGTRRMGSASIEQLLVPAPKDKSEQKEIASVFNDLDRAQETAAAKGASLKALFSATVHQLMTGSVRMNEALVSEGSNA